jgi:hypothetical protein
VVAVAAPGLPYPIWSGRTVEPVSPPGGPSSSDGGPHHLAEGSGSRGRELLQATQEALKLDGSSLPPWDFSTT